MPLRIQLLPTSLGDRSQTQSLTTFIINGTIALDAGSLGFSLSGAQLAQVEHVIITHSHLDHVASLPIAIAEVFPRLKRPMKIHATDGVLKAIRDHLMNGVIWPDFSKIKMLGSDRGAIEFIPIRPNEGVRARRREVPARLGQPRGAHDWHRRRDPRRGRRLHLRHLPHRRHLGRGQPA